MAKYLNLFILTALLLAGCASINPLLAAQEPSSSPETQTETPEGEMESATPEKDESLEGGSVENHLLTIWVPPQFDPNNGSQTGRLFKDRLEEFSMQNPGVDVVVRVKDTSGEAGLVNSLTAANAAAPDALPSLIALPRTDLEVAALKGLIYPVEEVSAAIDDLDWFFYAKQLSLVEGTAYGLPFAGDGLVLVYRPSKVGITPSDWDTIISRGLPMAFPAADNKALLTMSLYQSLGGEVEDQEARPILEADKLKMVLELYSYGAVKGTFPALLTQYDSDEQAWKAYKEGKTDYIVTWSSYFLTELPPDSLIVPLPPLGGQEYTLADGWVWAVSNPSTDDQEYAIKLAAFLVETDFMAEWTSSNGYLPPRPSALEVWKNQSQQVFLNQISRSAQVYPDNDILYSIGPVLRDVTIQMISQNDIDPGQVAQIAVERMAVPDIR